MSRVVVVAELGVNHNGSVDTALEMVRCAAIAGADAVKVQHFSASEFCTAAAEYKDERQVDLFRRYEMSRDDLALIAAECKRRGLVFFGTPDSLEHAKELIVLGAPWIKVGSDDLIHLPLLRALAALGKPMILSTGMASWDEIGEATWAINRVWESCGLDIAQRRGMTTVLHCVSEYPTPLARANLRRIAALDEALDEALDMPIGYSDHTDGIEAAVLAVALGATMIEKHFTLDRSMDGPDHAFSADPQQFAEMVRRIRQAELMLGDGQIDPGPEELEMRKLARRSCVAARALAGGHVIQAQDIAYKRPGTGVPPGDTRYLIGRRLAVAMEKDEQFRTAGCWAKEKK